MCFFSFTLEGLLSENDDLDFEIIPIEAVRGHILGDGSGGQVAGPPIRRADRGSE